MLSKRFILCLLVVLCIAFPGAAEAPGREQVKDYSFEKGIKETTVSFESPMNLVFFKARIDGAQDLWFILDSGFDRSILNADRLKEWNLTAGETHSENQPGGSVQFSSLKAGVKFSVPGLEIPRQSFVAFPMNALEPIPGRRVDGILGHDFFERFVITIDYAGKKLTFHEPSGYTYSGTGEMAPVIIENKEPFLMGEVCQPGVPVVKAKFKIDTGSADVAGFNGSFIQEHNVVPAASKKIPAIGSAAGGFTMNWATRLKGIRVGKLYFANPVVGFSGDLIRGGDAGTIGGEMFHRFTLIFDYSRDRLIFEKNKHFDKPYEFDMSGMRIIAESSGYNVFKVVYVNIDSPAYAAGIHNGDIIVEIDGKPAEGYNLNRLLRMLKINGKQYALKIKRGKELFDCTIKLRQLI